MSYYGMRRTETTHSVLTSDGRRRWISFGLIRAAGNASFAVWSGPLVSGVKLPVNGPTQPGRAAQRRCAADGRHNTVQSQRVIQQLFFFKLLTPVNTDTDSPRMQYLGYVCLLITRCTFKA